MRTCPRCGYTNLATVSNCLNCGYALVEAPNRVEEASGAAKAFTARPILPQRSKPKDTAPLSYDGSLDLAPHEDNKFPEDGVLRLDMPKQNKRIELKFRLNEVLLGRRDPANAVPVLIDLTPYYGYRLGVSRQHAKIIVGEDRNLTVVDLGSSNGSFINNEKLIPHHSYPLKDGDLLSLGNLELVISYIAPPKDDDKTKPIHPFLF